MQSYIILCAILLTLLQVADYWTTYKAIVSRKGSEANPIVRFFIERTGLAVGLFCAKFWAAVFIWIGFYAGWYLSLAGATMLSVVAVFYLAVVINNYKVWKI